MSSTITKMVQELINSDDVVIFSITTCPQCKVTKEIFTKLNKKYTVVELDKRSDGEEIRKVLATMTGAKTVPRVFLKGKCLGGGSEVRALYKSGELARRLK